MSLTSSTTTETTTTTTSYRTYPTSDPLICAFCHHEIDKSSSKAIKSGAKFWHEHHFNCTDCGLRLKENKVYQKDGKLYCESDYKNKFVPRCAYCSGHIMEACIKALNQTWHPEHFFCYKCKENFNEDEGFHEKNGYPYCKPCYIDMACQKCAKCKKPITDKALKAMEQDWHVSCFSCSKCNQSFVGESNFYCVKGQPLCEKCLT